jgi:hypothetical protein
MGALAPTGAAAAGGVDVSSDPGLFPRFATGTHDYVVRCDWRAPVRLSVRARGGSTVAVGGFPARGGTFETPVVLRPGRAFGFAVRSGGRDREYNVRCLPDDFPRWDAERSGRPQADYYVVAPGLHRRGSGYAAIFDDHGVPVWWMKDDPVPFNASLTPDGGIAWTQLTREHSPRSSGHFDEYALDGSRVRTFSARSGPLDLHELRVLRNGHFLAIRYVPRYHQSLAWWGGPADAGVLDGEIQELDSTGRPVWRWSTHRHVQLDETSAWRHRLLVEQKPIPLPGGNVYDTAHMNSIDVVGDKLVFSLRHTDGIYEIDRGTGRVVWKLGGTATAKSLAVVGDPLQPSLDGQHDARISADGRLLTAYDNGILRRRPPRAVQFRLDLGKRTATLVNAVSFAPASVSTCCGSARRLAGGNWVISWGNTPWVTELTGEGDPVLAPRFPARASYRAEPVLAGTLTRRALRAGMDAMAAAASA